MIPRPLEPPTNVDLANNSDVLVTVGPAKKNRSVCQVCQNTIIVPSVKVVFDYNRYSLTHLITYSLIYLFIYHSIVISKYATSHV